MSSFVIFVNFVVVLCGTNANGLKDGVMIVVESVAWT